jgi:microsomal dipeptidase-like Zn-dependent dipeptidase
LLGYKPEMYKGVWVDCLQQTIAGMGSLADLPSITVGLLRRHYSAGDVTKILGGNFVPVLSELWT